MQPRDEALTALLQRWTSGEQGALDLVLEPAYKELRRLANRELSAHRNQSIGPGTLVHEAYLRLRKSSPAVCENRAHFYALAARLMRHILVDHLRSQSAAKRQAGPVTLSEPPDESASADSRISILDIDAALDALAKAYPLKARIVELRFFSGLSIEETAEALDLSRATVKRNWVFAKTWIRTWLNGRDPQPA